MRRETLDLSSKRRWEMPLKQNFSKRFIPLPKLFNEFFCFGIHRSEPSIRSNGCDLLLRFVRMSPGSNIVIFPCPCQPDSSSSMSSSSPNVSRKIAVIGAGAAGLVATRELLRECDHHQVVVFERSNQVGGTWVYDPNIDSDPLGLDLSRTIVHSSLYESLRTNLPRQVMGFRDYPFVAKEDGRHRDSRMYPAHQEVLLYLKDFASHFKLTEFILFETEVVRVELAEKDGKWVVGYRRKRDSHYRVDEEEVYDAVVVCNGHYSEPRVAEIPGIDVWPGKQIHSHNYRVPEPFRNQVVVVIGASASAHDLCRDIAKVAKEVHVASRTITNESQTRQSGYDNMWLHSMIESAHEDGTVVFLDGISVLVDVILHCTGYKFHFPFLKICDTVNVDDNRVGPLYKHIFPPSLAPGLSFIGLPFKVLPFPCFELQSKWVAAVLSGRVLLPSKEEMTSDVQAFYSKLESDSIPKRYTHCMGDFQCGYSNWLAAACGHPASEEWRKHMFAASVKKQIAQPDTYRDEWDDGYLTLQAEEDFLAYSQPLCKGAMACTD